MLLYSNSSDPLGQWGIFIRSFLLTQIQIRVAFYISTYSSDNTVCIDPAARLRIIIPAVQVVEPGLVVVAVSAVQVRVPGHEVRALGGSGDVSLEVLSVEEQADRCAFSSLAAKKLVIVLML